MNYYKALSGLNNVFVHTFSPRNSGEREKYSEWKEFKHIPSSYQERINLICTLAEEYQKVHVKTATSGGRMRIFYSSKLKELDQNEV